MQAIAWSTAVVTVSGTIGIILLVSGSMKYLRRRVFRNALTKYDRFPDQIRTTAYWIIPPAEVAVGLLLITGWLPIVATTIALVLMVVLTAVVLLQRPASCGCLGSLNSTRLRSHVIANLTMIALLCVLFVSYLAETPSSRGELRVGMMALGAAMCVWVAAANVRARVWPRVRIATFSSYHSQAVQWTPSVVLSAKQDLQEGNRNEL